MTDHPLVSVIIPCYNAVRFIRSSVASAFAQSYPSIEVIVVDDGSTDGTYECLVESRKEQFPNLRLLTHEGRTNFGVSTSRYRGAEAASGEFIAFLDADDEFEPDKIEKQIQVLRRHPDVVLCHTAVKVIGDRSSASRYEVSFSKHGAEPYYFRRLAGYLRCNCICASSVLVRADILRKVPYAMPQLFQYEDWLCWSLVSAYGKFVFLDEKLIRYRVHEGSATAAVNRSQLRAKYSLLEMKLALAVRSESIWHCGRCLMSAGLTGLGLLNTYVYAKDYPAIDGDKNINLLTRTLVAVARGRR